jgi:phosphoesterase RecJ-like protein
MHLLTALGKRSRVVFADPIPTPYQSLPGAELISTVMSDAPIGAAILLECSSFGRASLDHAAFAVRRPKMTINIDHHQSGQNFADFNWIDPQACAVGAMVYRMAVAAEVPIAAPMATCLYTAVLTDTGSFTFEGTDASTFALAKHLADAGADPNRIAQNVFFSNTPARVRLLGAALSRIQIDAPIAWTAVTLADMQLAGGDVEDCEGIVNHVIAIAGVEAAAFLREVIPGRQYRLSLRSKGAVDVAGVAEQFGGGGHRSASGCTLEGTLKEAAECMTAALRSVSGAVAPALKLC